MKKLIITILSLLTIAAGFVYAERRPPARETRFLTGISYAPVKNPQTRLEFVRKVKEQEVTIKQYLQTIKSQKALIEELESVIKSQRAEINKLKIICKEAGIDKQIAKIPQTNDFVNLINDANETTTSFFGIRLGQKISQLIQAKKINPSEYSFEDKDHPGKVWNVQNDNPHIKAMRVSSYQGRIYDLSIYFKDASKINFETIKNQLTKKYGKKTEGLIDTLFGEVTFTPIINGIQLQISLNRDENVFKNDTLSLTYSHISLAKQLLEEIERRKAEKIKHDL